MGCAPLAANVGPNGTLFHATDGIHQSKYLVFGSNHYLLILESETSASNAESQWDGPGR